MRGNLIVGEINRDLAQQWLSEDSIQHEWIIINNPKRIYTRNLEASYYKNQYIYIYIGSRTPTKPAKIILHSKRYMRKLFLKTENMGKKQLSNIPLVSGEQKWFISEIGKG